MAELCVTDPGTTVDIVLELLQPYLDAKLPNTREILFPIY